MKNLSKIVLSLSIFVLTISSGNATILNVPGSYLSIHTAVNAAAAGDTILLASGTYFDTLTIRTSVTIASRYLLTGDSSAIDSTIWSPMYPRCLANIRVCSVRVFGIRFVLTGQPMAANTCFNADSATLRIDHCNFVGVLGIAIICGQSRLIATNCNIENGGEWILTSASTQHLDSIANCLFNGGVTLLMNAEAESVVVANCTFLNTLSSALVTSNLLYLRIHDCYFARTTNQQMDIGPTADGLIENVTFEACNGSNTRYPLISIYAGSSLNTILPIRNLNLLDCDFEGGVNLLSGADSLHGTLSFSHCSFINNQCWNLIQYHNFSSFDSCRFINNQNNATIFVGPIAAYSFSNCDVYGNTTNNFFGGYFDSVNARNCWWGAASGPLHTNNPNGLGQPLSGNINFTPWRTTSVFSDNNFVPQNPNSELPVSTLLMSVYPNPFNSTTVIRFSVGSSAQSTIGVYDLLGRNVRTLANRYIRAGEHNIQFDGNGLASGVYLVRLSTQGHSLSQRVVLLK